MSTENITTTAPAVVTGERTIEVITSEVIQLKADAGNAIIGIGERLIEAKEMLSHGEWLPWLTDQVEFSERSAQEFMKIAREWSNPRTLADYGKSKALKLLLLPPAEREEFIETHDVPNMSTRELEQAIKERDEARAALDTALADVKKAEEYAAGLQADMSTMEVERDAAKARVKELEDLPKDVYQDEAAIKKAADDARAAADAEWKGKFDDKLKSAVDEAVDVTNEEWQKKLNEVEEKLAKAEEKAKKAAAKAKTAGEDASKVAAAELDEARQAQANAEAEAGQLRAMLESATKAAADAAIASDADFTQCLTLAEQIKSFANTINGVKLKALNQGDEIKAEKLKKLILRIADDVRGCA